MKAKKKEVFFVRETPDNYEVDYSKAKRITNREHERLLKESKKTKSKKAA